MKSVLTGSWTKTAMVCAVCCFLVGLGFPVWNYLFGPTYQRCNPNEVIKLPSRAEQVLAKWLDTNGGP